MKYIVPLLFGALLLTLAVGVALLISEMRRGSVVEQAKNSTKNATESSREQTPPTAPAPRVFPNGKLVFWWDDAPKEVERVSFSTGPQSNIHPNDYVGYDACKKCHEKNYASWQEHPHRWMNAQVNTDTVKGDFSGDATIDYLGGQATFTKADDAYRMTLTRDDVTLVYQIDQTLGSRFYQYYIGTLVDGPFADGHPYRTTNHVLHFGYWLDKKTWVPVVHVGDERPDGERTDPFAMPDVPADGESFLPYAKYCNMCHSTFPLGDNAFRKPQQLQNHWPADYVHFDMPAYIQETHKELWPDGMTRESATLSQIESIPKAMTAYESAEHAATFGISCEACHFGCQEHVKDPKQLPSFAPRSPHLRVQNGKQSIETGRTHENLNWACGRCHTGSRPRYTGGMSTWNSTEFSDAMLGSCYSELKCIDCHSPHSATGKTWKPSPAEDDAKCIKCHDQYKDEVAIAAHTHHPVGTAGTRCLNCHMPQINEGLQDVVRTHTIFSPTNAAMIESNHPNACNLCHTDQSIDWTVEHLADWYDAKFDDAKITAAYKSRSEKVGLGWLTSENEAVRLVTIDAMRRNDDKWAAESLIDMLDDPYLLNRQFASQAVESVLDIDLQEHGYRFFMTPDERRKPIEDVRAAWTQRQ